MTEDNNNSATLNAINRALLALVERDLRYEQERAEHIGDIRIMNSAIEALTKSNKEVNANISKLVLQSERSQDQIGVLHDLVGSKHSELKQQLDNLISRVEPLERHNYEQLGERRAGERQKKFWSDNWFKIVTLVLISIPVLAVLHNVIKSNTIVGP